MTGKGILAIVAHPDDETFGCGGTLARHAEKGSCVNILSLTCSERERREELMYASKALGAHAPIVFEEERLEAKDEVIHRISDVIVSQRPDIVLAHLPYDYHREHRRAHRLVREAIEWAAHKTEYEEPWTVGRLLLMEVNTLIPSPHVIVDISEVFNRKLQAMDCYTTQLSKFPEGYYQRFNTLKAELRGVQGGCRYAEAFIEETLIKNSPFYRERSTKSLF